MIVRGKSDHVVTSAQLTFQFKIPYLGYRQGKSVFPFLNHVLNAPSERCWKIKPYQYRLLDQQSGKSPRNLFVMSIPH